MRLIFILIIVCGLLIIYALKKEQKKLNIMQIIWGDIFSSILIIFSFVGIIVC